MSKSLSQCLSQRKPLLSAQAGEAARGTLLHQLSCAKAQCGLVVVGDAHL